MSVAGRGGHDPNDLLCKRKALNEEASWSDLSQICHYDYSSTCGTYVQHEVYVSTQR